MKEKKTSEKDIINLREKIDKIDDNIISLLNKRGLISLRIGKLKKKEKMDIFQPNRELEVIERMKKKSEIIDQMNIEKIWKEIMKACKQMQNLKDNGNHL